MEKRMRLAGKIAFVSALLYALPHFWWGLGFPLAFPGDLKTIPDNFWSQLIGLWGFGVLAILAAMYALVFTSSWISRLPKWVITIPAWIGSIILSLWGFSYFVLQFQFAIGRVQSTPQFAVQDASSMALWGYFWYLLFLIWGVSLGVAAFYAQKLLNGRTQS